jgi:hypothetical protein
VENQYGKIQGGVRAPLTCLRLIVPAAGSTPMQLAKLSSSATARAGNRRQKASRRPVRPYKITVQKILNLEHAISLHDRLNASTRGPDRRAGRCRSPAPSPGSRHPPATVAHNTHVAVSHSHTRLNSSPGQ